MERTDHKANSGWYPVDDGRSLPRYWDGTRWTDDEPVGAYVIDGEVTFCKLPPVPRKRGWRRLLHLRESAS
jgi:hypothetical protein